jgi:hypothetical protein
VSRNSLCGGVYANIVCMNVLCTVFMSMCLGTVYVMEQHFFGSSSCMQTCVYWGMVLVIHMAWTHTRTHTHTLSLSYKTNLDHDTWLRKSEPQLLLPWAWNAVRLSAGVTPQWQMTKRKHTYMHVLQHTNNIYTNHAQMLFIRDFTP